MTTAAKSFTRTIFSTVWTFTVDPAAGMVAVERDGFELEGRRFPGFRHELRGVGGEGEVAMMRMAAVMVNRLRAAHSITCFPLKAHRIEGRRGFTNVNSWRWSHRELPAVLAREAAARDARRVADAASVERVVGYRAERLAS